MIRLYINDIANSLKNECYFSAMSLALMIPDICGMAEYPKKDVGERYVKWCDTYLIPYMYGEGGAKGLSGESIYNLRNVYFHQGSITIDRSRIKDNNNRIDKLLLVVGEFKIPVEMTIEYKSNDTVVHRAETIFVDRLCTSICECALKYYNDNKEKFSFECEAIHVNTLFPDADEMFQDNNNSQTTEEIEAALNNSPEIRQRIKEYAKYVPIDNSAIESVVNAEKANVVKPSETKQSKKKEISKEKKESQVRSFFGRHFRKRFYIEHKEEIIKAILSSGTKKQLKAKLYKTYPNYEATEIYKRLQPLLDDTLKLK